MAETIAASFGLAPDDVICISTPLFHVAGLLVWFQPAVSVGATCVLQNVWEAGDFMGLAETHHVTAVMMVPTQIIDLLGHPAFDPDRLKTVRCIAYAGAPMPPAVLEEAREALPWIEFIENYGQSELGSVTVRRGRELPDKAGSVGKAISSVETAIIVSAGTFADCGQPGELCVRGPGALLEYLNDPEETASLYKYGDGWVATGDIAQIDAEGFVTLVDRVRDVIISGGANLFPTEIENALYQHPAVEVCAVFAIPDARLGEVPATHVVCRNGLQVTEQELVDFCATRLSGHKQPRIVKLVDALPRTAVGKIRKNALRQEYRGPSRD